MKIEFNTVGFSYPGGPPVLSDISYTVGEGEVLLVLGHNGAGKSTLLKLLNGILKPTFGTVTVDGLDTRHSTTAELARRVCVTFQSPSDQLFASTIREEVEFAPKVLRRPNRGDLVNEALLLCGLERYALRHPYDLHPAHRKLVTIASAIASDAPLLAFDEPSAGLSALERERIHAIMTTLLERGKGFLVVTHDPDIFLPYATRTIVLAHGRILFDGDGNTLIDQPRILRRAGVRPPLSRRMIALVQRLTE